MIMNKNTKYALIAAGIALGVSIPITIATKKYLEKRMSTKFFVIEGNTIVGLTEYGRENLKGTLRIPHVINGRQIFGIGPEAFKGTEIHSVIISNGIIMIQDYAFANCKNLKNVGLPKTLVHIFPHAFDGCEALEKIILMGNLDTIESQAFANCLNLKDVKMRDKMWEVAPDAFLNDKEIRVIKIKEVSEPKNKAFSESKKKK